MYKSLVSTPLLLTPWFVRLDHAPDVNDLPQGFLHPKTSQSHVWEEIRLFRTLLYLLITEFYFKKHNFEDTFSGKTEVSGWMKTNMATASYHPWILRAKYGQTGNVKLLTANRSLSFAVKWPNLDLKGSINNFIAKTQKRINESF